MDKYLKANEAAEKLGVSVRSFYDLVKAGKIPRYRITPRTVRYAESDLNQYIRQTAEYAYKPVKQKRKTAVHHGDGSAYRPGDILV